MSFLVARHSSSSCPLRRRMAVEAATSMVPRTVVHMNPIAPVASCVDFLHRLRLPYNNSCCRSSHHRWMGSRSLVVPFVASASASSNKLLLSSSSSFSHRSMSNKSTDDESSEAGGEKAITTTSSPSNSVAAAASADAANNHPTNEHSSSSILLSLSKSKEEGSKTTQNMTKESHKESGPPNEETTTTTTSAADATTAAGTAPAADPEFNPVYVHPLSQIVLRHFQTSCHSWIVSKQLETLKIHRDGTFELCRPAVANDNDEDDPPALRIWTYYDNDDRKHWLSVSVNHVQHRFLLQDNLLSAWRGYKRNSLPERIQESVQDLIGAVDELE